jgi:hypothetical protein
MSPKRGHLVRWDVLFDVVRMRVAAIMIIAVTAPPSAVQSSGTSNLSEHKLSPN